MVGITRQLPEADEVFLDHVGWFVADLDRATLALERLGFAVAGETVHMNRGPDGAQTPTGTLNRLIVLKTGYLEFLASRGDTPLAVQHRRQLERYEGLHLLAFNSADVRAEGPRLAAEGFRPLEPAAMNREVMTERGPQEARFHVLRVPPGVMAEGRMQWCGHLTPELVWREGHLSHPNGAEALTGVLWAVADVSEALERYSRFLRKPSRALADGLGRIELERGALLFATPKAAEAFLPDLVAPALPFGAAVSVRVADLAETGRRLRSNGVRFGEAAGQIVVSPENALGVWLIFHEGPAPFEG